MLNSFEAVAQFRSIKVILNVDFYQYIQLLRVCKMRSSDSIAGFETVQENQNFYKSNNVIVQFKTLIKTAIKKVL